MTDHETDALKAPGLTRSLRELPTTCPDLRGRVQGRIERARTVRRGAISAAVLLVLAGGLAWQFSPTTGPTPLAVNRPVEPVVPAGREPIRMAAESLATLPPVAEFEILSDQQAAVWASLEKLTEEL
jgi:hypothetical protein